MHFNELHMEKYWYVDHLHNQSAWSLDIAIFNSRTHHCIFWWIPSMAEKYSCAKMLLIRYNAYNIKKPHLTWTTHTFNSTWFIDIIWRHRSGSSLAQVMACNPSPDQSLSSHQGGSARSLGNSFTASTHATMLYEAFEIIHFTHFNFPGAMS